QTILSRECRNRIGRLRRRHQNGRKWHECRNSRDNSVGDFRRRVGIHPCLLILKPSCDSATSGEKLCERSEDTSPLSARINCGKASKAFILRSKIPWNQKVAILL